MRRIPAGEFKQTCLRLLDEVAESGQVIVVTKRGRPVAQLAPVPEEPSGAWAGAMRGTGKILGDLVAPAAEPEDWKALRE